MAIKKVIDIAKDSVLTIKEDESLDNALKLMQKSNSSAIVILSSDERFKYRLLTSNDIIKLKLQKIDFSKPLKEFYFNKVNTIYENRDYLDVLEEMDSQSNYLCVVDDEHKLKGFVSYFDLISNIEIKESQKNRTINDVLLNLYLKSVKLTTPTSEVVEMMKELVNDCIIVNDSNNKAVGIITAKSITKLIVEKQDLSLPISRYMSTPVETIKPNVCVDEALNFMKKKEYKYLLIEDEYENILGHITQEELLSKLYSKIKSDKDKRLEQFNSLTRRASVFEQLSTIDLLTGLYNRSKLEKELDKEIERVRRYKESSFSLLFLDIDNFKKINESFGHEFGDKVLQEFSSKVLKRLRKSDVFGRWGGDEFVVIFPVTGIEDAKLAVKNIQKLLEELIIENVGKITCSYGISQFKNEDSLHSITLRADRALHEAKKSGINSIELIYE